MTTPSPDRRRKVVRHPTVDDPMVRLRRLLGMIESVTPREPTSAEALERAGFVRHDTPPPDRFLVRRMFAMIEEREARRLARKERAR